MENMYMYIYISVCVLGYDYIYIYTYIYDTVLMCIIGMKQPWFVLIRAIYILG